MVPPLCCSIKVSNSALTNVTCDPLSNSAGVLTPSTSMSILYVGPDNLAPFSSSLEVVSETVKTLIHEMGSVDFSLGAFILPLRLIIHDSVHNLAI